MLSREACLTSRQRRRFLDDLRRYNVERYEKYRQTGIPSSTLLWCNRTLDQTETTNRYPGRRFGFFFLQATLNECFTPSARRLGESLELSTNRKLANSRCAAVIRYGDIRIAVTPAPAKHQKRMDFFPPHVDYR